MFGIFTRHRTLRRQAEADADALIAAFGERAYTEARSRAREARRGRVIDASRSPGHWDRVRRLIGRKTHRDGLDAATRYLAGK